MKLVLGTMTFGQQVDAKQAFEMIDYFKKQGYQEIDTAYVYNEGKSERILGEYFDKSSTRGVVIATKVNPRITGRLDYDAVMSQFSVSMQRMKIEKADILYLHFPDPNTPIESALRACNELYQQGKIRELGLSNYSAEMLHEIDTICEKNEWIRPTIYEGVYNALSRNAEKELFAELRRKNVRFYAYNPLAGGMLSGKYKNFTDIPMEGRFACRPNYQNRYWKQTYFDAVEIIRRICEKNGIGMVEGAFRWLAYHSCLNERAGDGVILGVSKMEQLMQNIEVMKKGPLPEEVITGFEQAWEICKQDAPEYYRNYTVK